MTDMALPYPPPYQDIATLSAHTTLCERTIEMYVKEGLLPAPKLVKGKRLWKWKEVEKCLDGEADLVPNDVATTIREATAHAAKAR